MKKLFLFQVLNAPLKKKNNNQPTKNQTKTAKKPEQFQQTFKIFIWSFENEQTHILYLSL